MSKRRAERQITDRDRSEDDEPLEVFTGPGAIQVAAPEVLAERRIVKGRRGGGGKKPVESEPAPAEKPVSTEPSPFNFQMKPTDDKPVFNFTMLKPDEKPSFNFAADTNLFSFTPKSTAESPSKVLFSFSEDKELKPFTFKTPEKTQEKVEEKPLETQPAPKTPEKPAENAPEKTPEKPDEKPAEKPDEKPAEKPTEKESEKTPEKPASQATPSWSSTFSMPSLGSTEPAKFSFNTPVWPTFDTPFKGDASNPFGSITPFPSLGSLNSTTPASPFANIAATPSKLGVWGKDIAQPSAPEEQLNASIPSSPSHKIEKQVETKTGEEDEDVDFKAKAKLFEFEKDAGAGTWKERGIGEIKVNTNKTTKRSRIVMRMDSTLRLMLNVAIIPGMVVEQPNPKNVRFIAMNSINDGAPSAASFVVRLADGDGLARAINSAKAAREREEKKAD